MNTSASPTVSPDGALALSTVRRLKALYVLRRRSAVEPIIGHMKAKDHLSRGDLKGRASYAANVVFTSGLVLGFLWRALASPFQLKSAS